MAPETTNKSQYGDDVKSNKTAEVVCQDILLLPEQVPQAKTAIDEGFIQDAV